MYFERRRDYEKFATVLLTPESTVIMALQIIGLWQMKVVKQWYENFLIALLAVSLFFFFFFFRNNAAWLIIANIHCWIFFGAMVHHYNVWNHPPHLPHCEHKTKLKVNAWECLNRYYNQQQCSANWEYTPPSLSFPLPLEKLR